MIQLTIARSSQLSFLVDGKRSERFDRRDGDVGRHVIAVNDVTLRRCSTPVQWKTISCTRSRLIRSRELIVLYYLENYVWQNAKRLIYYLSNKPRPFEGCGTHCCFLDETIMKNESFM